MSFAGAFLLAALLQAQTGSGEIRGSVLGQRGGELGPLAFAAVELAEPAGFRSVATDGSGRFVLSGVPAGQPLRLRATYIGHEETRVEVTVAAGSSVTVDLVLTRKPIELPELLVGAGAITVPAVPERTPTPEEERARAELAMRALGASPGLAESGLAEAARAPPGNDPSDPSDVLFMRGSTADMKLVLLDGAPVYTPFHLGGLLRSFDEKVLGSAAHHVGGAPARYDGGLSYILDLRTRSPARERLQTSGSLDLMSAAATLETPLGSRAGVLLSTRTLHGLQSRLAGGSASPYGYLDALARAEVDLAPGHRISLLGFANEESVRLSLPAGSPAALSDAESANPRPRRPDGATWSNAALSLSYGAQWQRTALEVTAASSRYEADLPVPLPRASTGTQPPEGGPGQGALLASGSTARVRLAADVARFGETGAVRFGAAIDDSRMELGGRSFSPATGEGPQEYGREAEGTVVGGYLDATRRLSPTLNVRTGVRLDHFAPGGTRGALRLALLWSLTDQALLTVAGGRYHQLIRTTDADMELSAGTDATVGTGGLTQQVEDFPLLSLASSDHVVLSLDQQLAPGLRLTTEGFYKRFAGLDGVGRERLNASGLDLRILRQGGRMTGWLGYSLSWFWDSPDALGRADEFTGRHLLSVGLNGRVAGPWGLDLAVAYSDGLPLTSIPFGRAAANAVADESIALPTTNSGGPARPLSTRATDGFLRVDVELFAHLEPTWRNRTLRLRPYLRVLNALDQRDALFYYFEPWRDPELRPLAELSVIPVLGVEWRF